MINIFRKKNKLTALLALTAAVLMLCTGCMRSGVGVIIEPDDTGTVEIMAKAKETLACPLLITDKGLLGELVHRPAVKAVAIKDEHLASAILKETADDPQFKLYSGGNN